MLNFIPIPAFQFKLFQVLLQLSNVLQQLLPLPPVLHVLLENVLQLCLGSTLFKMELLQRVKLLPVNNNALHAHQMINVIPVELLDMLKMVIIVNVQQDILQVY